MSFIVIQHYQFPTRDPYKAGHVLTEIEANVLNWHRASLIQKTTQRWVLEAINGSEELLSMEELDKLTWRIKEFDATYEFSPRKTPKQSILEHNLDLLAEGILFLNGNMDPEEEDLERIKRTPEVQAKARALIRAGSFKPEELLS
jgi:hypothetical protein